MRVTLVVIVIFCLSRNTYSRSISDESYPRSKSDYVREESSEELVEKTSEETAEESWLARVIPEFQFPDLLKPVQIQIPLIQFPELPSYSISFAR